MLAISLYSHFGKVPMLSGLKDLPVLSTLSRVTVQSCWVWDYHPELYSEEVGTAGIQGCRTSETAFTNLLLAHPFSPPVFE